MSRSWARTQRRWAERGQWPRRPGRPSFKPEERACVRGLVRVQGQAQGRQAGLRPILRALKDVQPRVSRLLVEQEPQALERVERAAQAHERAQHRRSLEVLARDAVWGEDTTHLGRLEEGTKVEGEVMKDLATRETVGLAVGGVPTAQDAMALLEQTAADRGGWPLVWMADPGPINRDLDLVERLRAERVVHMLLRVHTPEDNASTERHHGELKGESGLGKGVRLKAVGEAAERAERARRTLDEGRRRATLGWRTAAQAGRESPRADALKDRDAFHRAACEAVGCRETRSA